MDIRLLTPGAGTRAGGFTLVEVVLAMAITMTVFLAIAGMFNTAFRTFSGSKRLTVATNLAYTKMADFKTMTVAQIKAQSPKSDTRTDGGVQYARTWNVTDVDVDGDGSLDMVNDLVKIALDVTWTHGGTTHKVSMATLSTGKPQ